MAYGSPDRLEDVPAYYADIRGGRPIQPELLDDLVERYRRLGIEDSNPLNAITEETRAALEARARAARLHRHEALDAADRRRGRAGARRRRRRDRRPRARAALLVALDRRLPRAARGRARRPRRARASSSSWHDEPGLRRAARRPRARAPTRTSSSRRTRCRRGSSTRATRTRTQLLETSRLVAETRRRRRLVVLVPERVADRRAVARAGHPRPPRRARTREGVRDVLVCPVGFVADHLEIRWDLDVEARGARGGARARARADRDAERRPGLRRACSRASSGGRSRYPRERDDRARSAVERRRRAASASTRSEARTLKELVVAPRPRPRRSDVWALAGRLARRRAGRGGRPRRPQRLRQDDAAAADRRDHQADRRARRRSAAASARCSSSAPASTPTSPAARTSTSTARSTGSSARTIRERFDEIVAFAELEHFIDLPGAHVLVGDVHAARLRGRGAHRRRRAPARRGVRRRRRGVPAQVLRQDLRVQAARRHDRLRLARRRRGRAALRARGAAARRAASSSTARRTRRSSRYRRLLADERDPAERGAGPARVGERRGARSRRRGCSGRTGEERQQFLAGEPLVAAAPDRRPSTASRRRGSRSSCATRRACSSRRTCSTRPSSAGTAPASASCASTSTGCRSPTGASTSASGSPTRAASGCYHWLDDALALRRLPGRRASAGVVRLEGRWTAETKRRRRRRDELAHLPRLAGADGARAGPPVQALHGRRGAAARPRR